MPVNAAEHIKLCGLGIAFTEKPGKTHCYAACCLVSVKWWGYI